MAQRRRQQKVEKKREELRRAKRRAQVARERLRREERPSLGGGGHMLTSDRWDRGGFGGGAYAPGYGGGGYGGSVSSSSFAVGDVLEGDSKYSYPSDGDRVHVLNECARSPKGWSVSFPQSRRTDFLLDRLRGSF